MGARAGPSPHLKSGKAGPGWANDAAARKGAKGSMKWNGVIW